MTGQAEGFPYQTLKAVPDRSVSHPLGNGYHNPRITMGLLQVTKIQECARLITAR